MEEEPVPDMRNSHNCLGHDVKENDNTVVCKIPWQQYFPFQSVG